MPVHDEAATVAGARCRKCSGAVENVSSVPFEIVVCENGSRDDTLAIARRLALAHQGIRVETLPTPDYGHALQHGIHVASYDKVVIFNVDFWSADFLETALAGLDTSDMVVGSKVMGTDRRPIVRRVITRSFNWFPASCGSISGGTGHARYESLQTRTPAASSQWNAAAKGWMFDTELGQRAEREGLTIVEKTGGHHGNPAAELFVDCVAHPRRVPQSGADATRTAKR